ncbi:SDR family oxidoreductase [Legionella dresdenensis]|uniref:SDR family oxidoreductase n=1 Tax=Legionella dresdenensis TaxID=450200 RepID=A0ABV8CH20_9GAMM
MNNQKKNIIIIGRGAIGLKIAQRLEMNHKIKIIDLKKPLNINHFQCDLTNNEEVKQTFNMLSKEFKKIDILIFAAGKVQFKPMLHTNPSEVQDLMNINYISVWNCLHAASPLLMKSKFPLIININSISEYLTLEENSTYAASKVATSKLLEIFTEENKKIKLSQIYLGAVKSKAWVKYPSFKQKNMIDPKYVANMIEWIITHSQLMHLVKIQMTPLKGVL